MAKLANITLREIREKHEGQFVWPNDAGLVWDDETGTEVRAIDVVVWGREGKSENSDGTSAVARYLIRGEE